MSPLSVHVCECKYFMCTQEEEGDGEVEEEEEQVSLERGVSSFKVNLKRIEEREEKINSPEWVWACVK